MKPRLVALRIPDPRRAAVKEVGASLLNAQFAEGILLMVDERDELGSASLAMDDSSSRPPPRSTASKFMAARSAVGLASVTVKPRADFSSADADQLRITMATS